MKQNDIEYLVAKEVLMRSEAYDEVSRQAAACCEGQERRCRRYRRGIKGVRYVAAFLFVIVTTTIYASAIYAQDFSEFHTTTDSSASHVCEIIYGMTGKF